MQKYILFILLIGSTACGVVTETGAAPARTLAFSPTPRPEFSLTPFVTATATLRPEPQGCLKPVEDYTRIQVNGWTLNQRTFEMLAHAQSLYGGELEITGYSITQGSYTDGEAASFGTHAGGGAVDLSVMRRGTYTVLWDDIPPLLHALRTAGFAAWLREYGELYADSPYHIHAIAVGDAELSAAAELQLTGEAGYFLGFSGLKDLNGDPTPDRYGEPIVCDWMGPPPSLPQIRRYFTRIWGTACPCARIVPVGERAEVANTGHFSLDRAESKKRK